MLSVNRDVALQDFQTAGIVSGLQDTDTEVVDQLIVALPATSTSLAIYQLSRTRFQDGRDLTDPHFDGFPLSEEPLWIRHGTSWTVTASQDDDDQSFMQRHRPSSAPKPSFIRYRLSLGVSAM